MQEIVQPGVQQLPVAEGQRLADGKRDFPRLRQDIVEIGGNIAVPEHLLMAHHEPVFIGCGGFEIR